MKRPFILVSNDDGITAPGIRKLVELMKTLGDVLVVAPDSPQSGMGHAITVGDTLRMSQSNIFDHTTSYECSGTPADCIKLAKYQILEGKKPDLVVSGINHGSNSSINVLYSGTMSAAIEAAIEGYPAIGFSLCDFSHDADFSHVDSPILTITKKALDLGIPSGTALNVNIPAQNKEPIKGIKICRQANAKWGEEFDKRKDPFGREYFWMVGSFVNFDNEKDNDVWALENNYVSIVPCQFDLTDLKAKKELTKKWKL